MKVLGIDEAGRGPVIGPMVMVGFLIEEEVEEELRKMGVKDSKQLTPEEREELAEELRKMGKVFVKFIHPWQIDAENLNRLERNVARAIIMEAKPDRVIIDGFERNLEKKLGVKGVEIVAEPKADERYPVVSAASIIAKVTRDRMIEKLKRRYGEFGTGYPSDERTVKFLEELIREEKKIPDFVRKSWETTRRIIEKEEQRTLDEF